VRKFSAVRSRELAFGTFSKVGQGVKEFLEVSRFRKGEGRGRSGEEGREG
jgi:hypothetical protein